LQARNAEAGEDYVTLRNDRFVIPVRAENRRACRALFMVAVDGQTSFLEPFETVERTPVVQLRREAGRLCASCVQLTVSTVLERLEKNCLPRSTATMNNARHASPVLRAYRNHEAIVAQCNVILAGFRISRLQDLL